MFHCILSLSLHIIFCHMPYLSIILVTSQFHVRVHVAAPSSCKALVLDHALLYCIGVNLPTHHSGQLDRVLVLASPVTDVNLHAWNLSRVKRLIVMDIGIQMELCSNCSGCHEKKVVMFLLPSDLIEDCMNFLLHEMQATDVQPQRSEPNDPIIYVLPHQCGGARSASPSFLQHQQQQQQRQQSYDSTILEALNSHPASNAPLPVHESPVKDPPGVSPNPVLPPRNQLRPNYQEYIDGGVPRHVSSGRSHAPVRYRHDHFEVPYHISQRIYINDTGTIRHESQVLGSGSGEFRANNGSPSQPPRVIVTESSKATGYNPVYISTDDIHPGPTPAGHPRSTGPNKPIRPEFIGRRRPMLPPRSSDIFEDIEPPPPPPPHSVSPFSSRTPLPPTSTSPQSSPSPPLTPPLPTRGPPSPPPSYSQDDPDTGSGYVNVEGATRCTSSLSLCTDDITNADFALMTKVTFKNIIPALPPRSNKQPVPTPRKQQNLHKTQNTPSNSVVSTQQSSSEYSYASAPFYGFSIGGYSSVVHHTDLRLERPRSQSSGSLCLNQMYDRTMHHGKVSNEC